MKCPWKKFWKCIIFVIYLLSVIACTLKEIKLQHSTINITMNNWYSPLSLIYYLSSDVSSATLRTHSGSISMHNIFYIPIRAAQVADIWGKQAGREADHIRDRWNFEISATQWHFWWWYSMWNFLFFMKDSKRKRKTYQNHFNNFSKLCHSKNLRQTVSRQSEPRQNVSFPLIRQSVSRQSRHDA